MKRAVVGAVVVLGLAFASPGGAMMEALSTERLTKSSDLVVEGEVENVVSAWTADRTAIMSSATISVVDVVRGTAAPISLTVEYEGGEVGEVGMGVSDGATVAAGQKVLIFLRKKRSSLEGARYEFNGSAQGVYRIGADRIARKGGFSVLPGSGDAIDNDLDLDQLKAKIRGVR